MPCLRSTPDEIASPQAKLVYLALVTEQASASEIRQLLGFSRLTILRSLTANDRIERTEEGDSV